MAISRGSSTEIIRCHHFEDIDSADTVLILGVQHHIYTVLSIIVNAKVLQASGNVVQVEFVGFDAKGGASAQTHTIFKESFGSAGQTFVWNDKFSFNGSEPDWSGATGAMTTTAEQDLIADQGSATVQYLKCSTTHADDGFEIAITFIDQNNA